MKQKSGSDGIKKNMRQIRENLSNKTWSLVSNSSLSKILGLKIIFGKKKLGSKKHCGNKEILGLKEILGPKNFLSSQNIFGPKKF